MRAALGAYVSPGNSVLPFYTPIDEFDPGEERVKVRNSMQTLPAYLGVEREQEGNLRRPTYDERQILPLWQELSGIQGMLPIGETPTETETPTKPSNLQLGLILFTGIALGAILVGVLKK